MTTISVFDFHDYKVFLEALSAQRASLQRGFRSRLAEALDCQNAYISQVLNTHANFSLEQGFKISQFLQLTGKETRYFILLIEHARAGTADLRAYFETDLRELREKHLDIKERVGSKQLSSEDQSIYYSSWMHATVHVLTTIPKFRTASAIAEALSLEMRVVTEVLLFLLQTGLLVEKKNELHPGETQLHLGKDSPHIRQHHANFRIAAIQSLSSKIDRDLHYSTVSSLSVSDAEKLKSKLVQVIQEYVETVKPSKEEALYNFNLDFYNMIKK
jgi:uncharacterized protein (TIGR02147 family)